MEVAGHRISGIEVEGNSQPVFILCIRIPLEFDGDTEVTDIGVGLLCCGGRRLEELQTHVLIIIPVAGRLHIVVEWVPVEVVAQARGELPMGG